MRYPASVASEPARNYRGLVTDSVNHLSGRSREILRPLPELPDLLQSACYVARSGGVPNHIPHSLPALPVSASAGHDVEIAGGIPGFGPAAGRGNQQRSGNPTYSTPYRCPGSGEQEHVREHIPRVAQQGDGILNRRVVSLAAESVTN